MVLIDVFLDLVHLFAHERRREFTHWWGTRWWYNQILILRHFHYNLLCFHRRCSSDFCNFKLFRWWKFFARLHFLCVHANFILLNFTAIKADLSTSFWCTEILSANIWFLWRSFDTLNLQSLPAKQRLVLRSGRISPRALWTTFSRF